MRVLLLFSNSTIRAGKAFPDELQHLLQAEANKRGEDLQFFVGYARSLSFLVSNGRVRIRDHRNRINLEDYDFVYFRKAGAAMQQMQSCARYLKDRGVPFWDKELLKANSRNKLTQMVLMEHYGLPIPATLFCRNRKRLLRLVTKTYREVFGFPLIVKATGGTRGDANYLVKDAEGLASTVKDEPRRSFIVQEFIPNDGDYRFFVAGGRLRGIIGRQAQGDSHLSNTSQGGKATLLSTNALGEEIRQVAVHAASIFGRDVAGVDIILDKRDGRPYILEVNRAPQIERASFEPQKAEWMVSAVLDAIADHEPSSVGVEGLAKAFVGRYEYVHLKDAGGSAMRIVAKVDTGADSSSLHCDNLKVTDGALHFTIHGKDFVADKYFNKRVRSSNGELQSRYLVSLPVRIGSSNFMIKVTLNDRSSMSNAMLIGRRFLREHRLNVDVGRRYVLSSANKGAKPQ